MLNASTLNAYPMEILAKIFNGPAKPKIMRIFIFNPTMTYDMADIAGRSQVSLSQARAEVSNLLKAGVIRKKNFVKEVHTNKGKKVALKKRWVNGFTVNEKFQYLKPLQDFLLNTNAIKPQDVMKKVKRVGRIKLLIVAGVFIRDLDSRVDILVVGDRLRRRSVEAVMSSIE